MAYEATLCSPVELPAGCGIGVEPTPSRLTAGCTTIVLSHSMEIPAGFEPALLRSKRNVLPVTPRGRERITRLELVISILARWRIANYAISAQCDREESRGASKPSPYQSAAQTS